MLLFCPCGEDVCFLWIMVANHAVKVPLLDGLVESIDTFKGGHIGEQEAVWADANYGTVLFMEPLVHDMLFTGVEGEEPPIAYKTISTCNCSTVQHTRT